MMRIMSNWWVYILRCADDSLYTGITTDVDRRLVAHRAGTGAKYTRARLPVEVVWRQKMKNGSLARKREAEIKSWNRQKKLRLIES